MPRKQESMLGLVPVSQRGEFGGNGHLIELGSKQPSNRDERWVLDEYQKQTLIMKGVGAKTIRAMKLIAEIQKAGVATFDEATGYILKIKDNPRTKEHQAYIDEFSTRAMQLMGRDFLAVMEVGATSIGVELDRPLYPPSPLEPPSLWKRIFG